VLELRIDASDVPADYIISILPSCSTFPEVLIFFLKGRLTARYLLQRQHLATIDTYFLVDCKKGGAVAGPAAAAARVAAVRAAAAVRAGGEGGAGGGARYRSVR
jgi:hypothetical protein